MNADPITAMIAVMRVKVTSMSVNVNPEWCLGRIVMDLYFHLAGSILLLHLSHLRPALCASIAILSGRHWTCCIYAPIARQEACHIIELVEVFCLAVEADDHQVASGFAEITSQGD